MRGIKIFFISFYLVVAFLRILVAGGDVFDIIEIRNRSNNKPTNIITWDTNISVPTNGWIVANQYIYIHYNKNHTTRTGWGLQIYTDNTTNTANPIYVGIGDPCGIVETNMKRIALPLAWRICDALIPNISNPTERADHKGFTDYKWHFMLDKGSSAFTNEKEYIVAYNQGGIAWHEGVRQHKPTNAYIYIAAKFDKAIGPTIYKTSMLKIEEFYNPTEPKFLDYFWIYEDGWYNSNPNNNHYEPAYMGTVSIYMDHWQINPHSGVECIQFKNGGTWGGVYYLEPANVWATGPPDPGPGVGYDLTGATKLTFWIRADQPTTLKEYGYGLPGDSCGKNQYFNLSVTTNWQEVTINLSGKDLSHVSGGFYFVANNGVTFYLDDIRYEKGE